jgi:hypothetical protein
MSVTSTRLVIVLLSACAAGARAPEPAPTAATSAPASPSAPAPTLAAGGAHTPVTVVLERVGGAPTAGGQVHLRAHVQRHGGWAVPITIDVVVPAGAVAARRGAARRVLAADPTPGDTAIDLDLAIPAGVPVDDLVVIASARVPGAGFHAEARYRFDRAAPAPVMPPRTGPSLRTGKANFGPSTPLAP